MVVGEVVGLLIGGFVAAIVSGAAGFGGALLLLPRWNALRQFTAPSADYGEDCESLHEPAVYLPTVLFRRASFATSWVVLFTMLWTTAIGLWGSFFPSPTALLAPVATAHSHSLAEEEAEHKQLCHCINCPGGKLCCCLKLTSAAERLVIRASCDQGAPLASASTLGVALAPVAIMFAFTEPLLMTQQEAPVLSFSLPNRAPSPLAPPPQNLS
jgi:hypothetical protein